MAVTSLVVDPYLQVGNMAESVEGTVLGRAAGFATEPVEGRFAEEGTGMEGTGAVVVGRTLSVREDRRLHREGRAPEEGTSVEGQGKRGVVHWELSAVVMTSWNPGGIRLYA